MRNWYREYKTYTELVKLDAKNRWALLKSFSELLDCLLFTLSAQCILDLQIDATLMHPCQSLSEIDEDNIWEGVCDAGKNSLPRVYVVVWVALQAERKKQLAAYTATDAWVA